MKNRSAGKRFGVIIVVGHDYYIISYGPYTHKKLKPLQIENTVCKIPHFYLFLTNFPSPCNYFRVYGVTDTHGAIPWYLSIREQQECPHSNTCRPRASHLPLTEAVEPGTSTLTSAGMCLFRLMVNLIKALYSKSSLSQPITVSIQQPQSQLPSTAEERI